MPRLRPVLLAAPVLLASACAPDFNDRNQRATAGVGAGAVLGGIIGSVTGSAGRGALIGGALGGLAGAVAPAPDAGYGHGAYGQDGYGRQAPYPAQGYDPRHGGWYDQHGQWHQGPPPNYGGYQPNYR